MVRQPARSNAPTTPENYPIQSPPTAPSGDYSYTLEIVMNMQVTMGRLLEAVESLKADSKEHRSGLTDLAKEVHGYKIGIRWVIGVCIVIGGIVGWAVNAYISSHPGH